MAEEMAQTSKILHDLFHRQLSVHKTDIENPHLDPA